MRLKLIISANGPDRKGIVSEISSIISKHNANIETSKMIRLEKEFAMLILIEIQKDKKQTLNDELSLITDLSVNLIETKTNQNILYENKFHLYINGADNEGIVYTFTNYLQNQKINIKDLETEIKNAPVTGYPLFFLSATILIPNKLGHENIRKKLIELSHKHNVAIKLEAIDY